MDRTARPLGGHFRQSLLARRHSALLAAIVIAFAVRPLFSEGRTAVILFSVALVVLLLVALYTVQVDELIEAREVRLAQQRRRWIVAWALAVPGFVERLYVIFFPNPRLWVVSTICWFVFFTFITWSLLRSLIKSKEVTGETIALSVSVYLLTGLTWGMLYIVIFQLQPDAFSFAGTPSPSAALTPDQQHIFPIFIYFSLTTLSTIGFGDILPLTLQARYVAVAEGITGQFYLAILVARLVALHMSRATTQNTSTRS